MGVSGQSSASLDTFAGHAEHVFSVTEGAAPLPAETGHKDLIAARRHRCRGTHRQIDG
jgi:hypothetical protein